MRMDLTPTQDAIGHHQDDITFLAARIRSETFIFPTVTGGVRSKKYVYSWTSKIPDWCVWYDFSDECSEKKNDLWTSWVEEILRVVIFTCFNTRDVTGYDHTQLLALKTIVTYGGLMVQKSGYITSWYGKCPIVYRVLYIPGGAGFLNHQLYVIMSW